jgi:transcription elongation GreA/GreB family factor
MDDLFATLGATGIEPLGGEGTSPIYTVHKTVQTATHDAEQPDLIRSAQDVRGMALNGVREHASDGAEVTGGIRVGDRVVVRYLDENRSATITVSKDSNDPSSGIIAATSPLGRQLVGAQEEDEVEFEADGHMRRLLIVRTDREAVVHQP